MLGYILIKYKAKLDKDARQLFISCQQNDNVLSEQAAELLSQFVTK
jgi:hypothetical protein